MASVARTLLMAARRTHEVPWFAWQLAVLELQRCPPRGCRRTHGPRTLGQLALLAIQCAVESVLTPDAERHWGAALALVAPGSRVQYAPCLAWAPALVAARHGMVRHGMVRHAPLPEAKQVHTFLIAEI